MTIKVGDVVKIVTDEKFVRCGYPVCFKDELTKLKDVESIIDAVAQLMEMEFCQPKLLVDCDEQGLDFDPKVVVSRMKECPRCGIYAFDINTGCSRGGGTCSNCGYSTC